jgi:ligand-binding SRPBCC domain-containing protein
VIKFYRHSFKVNSTLTKVIEFHAQSANMAALTPPPIVVRMQKAPAEVREGDEMAFTLWLGPLPVRWLLRIEEVSAHGFTDRQLQGPFKKWVHRHKYHPLDEEWIEVVDEIELELRPHLIWWPVGFFMWLNLPVLFGYRGRKTRQILAKNRGKLQVA